MMTKTHNFFLLKESPYPFMASMSSFNLLLSLSLMFKYSETNNIILSSMNMSLIALSWWINYSMEFNKKGWTSYNLEKGLKFSMIMFICSEIFFFFAFFWSYFHFFLSPNMELGLSWPPLKIQSFNFMNVPLVNTILLLTSGATVTASHYFLSEGKKKMSTFFLMMTIVLGMLFTYLQKLEYESSFFSISDSTFGTSFFILTGFHGIHVIVGSLFLLITMMRFYSMINSKNNSSSFEMASWYWHFVDVVWIFLYFIIYFLNS